MDRHLRISREQTELRERSAPKPEAGPELPPEIRAAAEAADSGAWYPQLNNAKWCAGLARTVEDLELSERAGDVTRVLEAWTVELEREPRGVKPGQPERRDLWSRWSSHRDWLRATLDGTPPPSAGNGRGRRQVRRAVSAPASTAYQHGTDLVGADGDADIDGAIAWLDGASQ